MRDELKPVKASLVPNERRSSQDEIVDRQKRSQFVAAVESEGASLADGLADIRCSMAIKSHDDLHQEAIFSAPSSAFASTSEAIIARHSALEISAEETMTRCNTNRPLYKILKKGDRILAKYSDGMYYPAKILTTIQKNYPSASYDIEFEGYGTLTNISWKDALLIPSTNPESNFRTDSDIGSPARGKDTFGRDCRSSDGKVLASQLLNENVAISSTVNERITSLQPELAATIKKRSRWDVIVTGPSLETTNSCVNLVPSAVVDMAKVPVGFGDEEKEERSSIEVVNPSLLNSRKVGKWKTKNKE
jgi:hypothetical protein